MAKELPYFKFEPNAWDSGMVQLCSLQAKGLFIEICCLYWSRLGELPYALALQKLCNGDTSLLQELEKNQIYEVQEDKIIIEFLDIQLNEFQETSAKRKKAANKRWKDTSAMQVHSKSNAIREEKRREDKSKGSNNPLTPKGENTWDDFIKENLKGWDSYQFRELWKRWRAYKKDQHRFTFKSKDSEQSAMKRLYTMAEGSFSHAKEIVDYTISQTWKGFQLPENLKQKNNVTSHSQHSRFRQRTKEVSEAKTAADFTRTDY